VLGDGRAVVLKNRGQCIGQILQEVPPVRNLKGIRSTIRDALGVGLSTITRDNLDAGMLA
jgi:hypothetical protein